MILFMILWHCLVGAVKTSIFGSVLVYYPLLFFMAWFFFKGGMYYKSEPLSACIWKSIDRLLLPYFFFSLISVVVALFVRGLVSGFPALSEVLNNIPKYIKLEGAVECNAPLWFLLTLFLVRIFFSFSQNLKIPAILVALVSLLSSLGLYLANLPIGLYFENIALGLFFFSLGYIFRDLQYKSSIYYISLAFYCVFLVYCFIDRSVIGTFNNNTLTPYLPVILFFIAGCIVVNNIFTKHKNLQIDFLSRIGEDSMLYYLAHFIIIISLVYIRDNLLPDTSDWILFIIILVSEVVFLPLFVNALRKPVFAFITGNNKSQKNYLRLMGYSGSNVVIYTLVTLLIGLMVFYVLFQFQLPLNT